MLSSESGPTGSPGPWHGTTILTVRKDGQPVDPFAFGAIAGDISFLDVSIATHISSRRDNRRPGLSEVGCLIHIRTHVAERV